MIEFKLDTQSMDKLFPEGSTARVNLQSSIVASLAKRFIKPSDDLQRILNDFKNQAVKEAAADFGLKPKTWGGGYELTEIAKSTLKDDAVLAVRTEVSRLVKDAVKEYMSDIDAHIERRVTAEVDTIIRTRVAARLKELTAQI